MSIVWGDFEEDMETTPGYAQSNPKLRKMEAEAYLLGNMLFRDWEDGKKAKNLQESKEKPKMNINTIKKLVRIENAVDGSNFFDVVP